MPIARWHLCDHGRASRIKFERPLEKREVCDVLAHRDMKRNLNRALVGVPLRDGSVEIADSTGVIVHVADHIQSMYQ